MNTRFTWTDTDFMPPFVFELPDELELIVPNAQWWALKGYWAGLRGLERPTGAFSIDQIALIEYGYMIGAQEDARR